MNSIRCPQCSLLNWETSESCKRCKTVLKANENLISPQNPPPDSSNQQKQIPHEPSKTPSQNHFFDEVNGFIAKNIQRCHRNLIISCAVIVIAILGVGIFNIRYLCNALIGPKTLERSEIAQNSSQMLNSFNYYVRVNGEDVYDSGVEYIETSRKYNTETVKHKYAALIIEDKILIAKVEPAQHISHEAKFMTLNGALSDFTSQEQSQILEPLFKKQPELRADVLPFILDAREGFSTTAYIGLGIGFVLLIITGLILFSVIKNYGKFEGSSISKSLAAFGNPKEVAAQIDFETKGKFEQFGSVSILPSWIIQKGTFTMNFQSIEDIVWVYKKTTKHSVNFIPTGKTHEVILNNKQGKSISLSGLNEKKTDSIIETIYQRIPWVIAGYDDQLMGLWNANINEFIKATSERKQALLNKQYTAQA